METSPVINLDDLIFPNIDETLYSKIDLGCGKNKEPGYFGIDNVQYGETDYILDLDVFPWPIASKSVGRIIARHIFEYLSNPAKVLEECKRILTPGGTAHIYLYTTDGRGAFSCPMHKSFWNLDLFLNLLPNCFHIIGGTHEIKDKVVTFEVKIIKKGRTFDEE